MSASTSLSPAGWAPVAARPQGRIVQALVPILAAGVMGAAIATSSPLLIALALAPLVLAVLTRPDGALLLFAVGLYLNLPVLLSLNTGIPSAITSLFALLLAVPFLAYVVIGRRPLVITPALGLMIGYLVILVLSATLPGGAVASTVKPIVTFLTEGLLLYVLVTNVVRTSQTLRRVLWAVVLAGALMGTVSIWQEVTGSYSTTLAGFAQVDSSGFDVGNDLTGKELRPRLAGPIGEKNRYAQIMLVLFPLAVSRIRAERRRSLRLAAAVCSGLILSGALLTFSRGAAVAVALLVVAMALLKMIAIRHLVALLVGLVVLVAVVAPDYVTRIQSLAAAESATTQGGGADGALQGRATENLAAYYVFRDHPLLGVGPDQFFREYSQQYGNDLNLRFLDENRRAHNLYLEIAADTGALGLAAFLAIVGVTMFQLWRLAVFWRHRDRELTNQALAFVLALVAYLSTGIFLQLAYQRYFWFILALANAAIWILRREARRADAAVAT